jgi:hypothetical protein
MSACLRRFQWRSDAPIYRLCMSLVGRTGRARAGLDGAVGVGSAPTGSASGLAGSACGPGKTARRCGSSCRQADPASWPVCPASTSRSRSPDRTSLPGAGQLYRWRRPSAGTPTRCDARTARTGIARVRPSCQQRVPGRARERVRVERDVGPRHLTIVEYRAPWRQGAGSELTRFPGPGSAAPGRQDLSAPVYWRDRHLRLRL